MRVAVPLAALLAAVLLAACQRVPAPAPAPSQATASQPAPLPSTAAPTTPAGPSVPATDDYLLPGAFGHDTDQAMLEHRFGTANVRVADVPGAEGASARGIILFPDDPARRAYLYFDDERNLRGLAMVGVFDMPSRWELDNGVRIGMPLEELVALNGKAIRFTGFDWDYGGAISDWNDGRLQPASDAPAVRRVRLGHADAGNDAYPMGDATFSSDEPRYPRLGRIARVEEIGVAFASGDGR